jgi:hypothetical protein
MINRMEITILYFVSRRIFHSCNILESQPHLEDESTMACTVKKTNFPSRSLIFYFKLKPPPNLSSMSSDAMQLPIPTSVFTECVVLYYHWELFQWLSFVLKFQIIRPASHPVNLGQHCWIYSLHHPDWLYQLVQHNFTGNDEFTLYSAHSPYWIIVLVSILSHLASINGRK